jgi:hypothetical protein
VWFKREWKGISEFLRKRGQWDDVFVTVVGSDENEDRI